MNNSIMMLILLLFVYSSIYSEDSNSKLNVYKSIDFNINTPCNCENKTERTYQLSKGLKEQDLENYKLYAYDFEIGDVSLFQKLFKAFEQDNSIHKISIIEWSKIMIIADDTFNYQDFEAVAKNIFFKFNKITPLEYLNYKNYELLQHYKFIQTKENISK